MASDSDRELEIVLMEDDVFDDDTVKYYYGEFSGRTLKSMRVGTTVTSGEIEPAAEAEMYIDCKVYRTHDKNKKDPENGFMIGKLFNYQIGINS